MEILTKIVFLNYNFLLAAIAKLIFSGVTDSGMEIIIEPQHPRTLLDNKNNWKCLSSLIGINSRYTNIFYTL